MKILQVVAELNSGGVESLLKNYFSNMSLDSIQFDFVTHGEYRGLLEDYFESKGCKIYHITPASKNLKKHFDQINQIMKNEKYDLIQVHQGNLSWPIIFFAWKNRIIIRIAHSHQAYRTKMNLKNKIYLALTKLFATDLWACGEEAGFNMWGNRKFFLMHNAIEIEKFKYDADNRSTIRSSLGLTDEFVIGHIGRFTDQKNHEFIVELASKLKQDGLNFKIVLIGDGPKEEKIRSYAIKLGCDDKILFIGLRDDVNKCLSAMDLMILPSNFEGLPVVMVEAEANGLPIMASNKITKEVKILDNVQYLPIDNCDTWCSTIISGQFNRVDYSIAEKRLRESGYDIKTQAVKVQNYYKQLIHQRV